MAYTDPRVLFGQSLMQRPIDTRSAIGGLADVGTRLIGAMLAKPGIEQARRRQAQAGKLANLEYANALMDFRGKQRRQNFLQSILGGQMPGSAAPPPSTWTEGDPEMFAKQPEMPQQAMTGGPLGDLTEQERLALMLNPNLGAGLKSVFDMRAKQANAPLVTLIKPGDETSAVSFRRDDPRINDFLGQGYVQRQSTLMPKQQSKGAETLGAAYANELIDTMKRGQTAKRQIANLGAMRRLGATAAGGTFAGMEVGGKRLLKAFGLKPSAFGLEDNVAASEAFVALQTELLLGAVSRLQGPISEKELAQLERLNPALTNTKAGRELIIRMAEKLAQREVDEARFAREYARNNKGQLDINYYAARDEHFEGRFDEASKRFVGKRLFEGLDLPLDESELNAEQRAELAQANSVIAAGANREKVIEKMVERGFHKLVYLVK